MRLARLNKKLEGIKDASKKGRKVQDLFQLMTNCKEIWYEAYARIYSNKGAVTKGVTDNTLDGFSKERVEKIIRKLKEKTYRFTPARRVYIPKRNGKKRPLGIPTGDDKLVGEVARILLQRIYEPIFSSDSHGFRPHRSCHTALEEIHKVWKGTKWFIEFDIKGFFSNMAHEVLIKTLEKKIDDTRFIKLISSMLRAGYLEDWTHHWTYSGTPQGSIVSPILSNIYLHELDSFIEILKQEYTKGKRRKASQQYSRVIYQKIVTRKKIDRYGKRPNLINELRELDRIQKTLPSKDAHDKGFRRLRYCRYADDFVLGFIGSLDEAKQIMNRIKTFLSTELKLQVADEKTQISKGTEGIIFLSYKILTNQGDKVIRRQIMGRHTRIRSITQGIRLEVPKGKVQQFCQTHGFGDWQRLKPLHRPELLRSPDEETIYQYNAELRGLANYYLLASNMKQELKRLEYLANYSLFKTLASKYKVKQSQIIARLRKGDEFIHQYQVKGETRNAKVFKLKHIQGTPRVQSIDTIPNTSYLKADRSQIVKRLNAEMCEYCGRKHLPVESHHVRKLKDLRKKPHLKTWEKDMIAMNRKTYAICTECHSLLHAGKLPDKRHQPKS